MSSKPRISIVVAIGNGRLHNRVLGYNNALIWHIPDDLKRFRSLTRGHPVVMGRKTFESIVAARGSGLPDRPNIVVTRDSGYKGPPLHQGSEGQAFIVPKTGDKKGIGEFFVVGSIEEGIAKAKEFDAEEIFIGGGGEVYTQALPFVDKLYLTLIDDDKEGDSYFPEYENEFTKKTFEEEREWNGLKYRWIDLERE
ncbi:MAG TPA: dihydrofolate reductase [Candidatus Paceibacterota bacterium]|nr:dihydrofolate reductase [Candidatus Paceibacterota bacterium]